MTSKDFIIWLRGFTEGVHQYNITPVQWETLKEQLKEVDDNVIPMGGTIVDHNTFKVNDQGFYQNLSGTGSSSSSGIITTTPGHSYITFSSGSGAWQYTTTNDKTLLND